MRPKPAPHNRKHLASVFLNALHALPSRSIPVIEAQIANCNRCRQETIVLRSLVRAFVSWPTDILRPAESLWGRLARRIANETGAVPRHSETTDKPKWEPVAPGINVQILSRNLEKESVSMLVRLDPRTVYPAHIHAAIEELHLLHGALKVDDRMLYPGDFIHAEAGSVDHRVWSETGCTCILMTSTNDVIL